MMNAISNWLLNRNETITKFIYKHCIWLYLFVTMSGSALMDYLFDSYYAGNLWVLVTSIIMIVIVYGWYAFKDKHNLLGYDEIIHNESKAKMSDKNESAIP